MPVTYVLAVLGTGVGVGFVAGLLGVGGCFIMIPVQHWVYTGMGASADVSIKLAFDTNLAVVLPTALSGAMGHQRKGMVWWKAAMFVGGFALIGSVGGATAAAHIAGATLKVAFGAGFCAMPARERFRLV